jgi:hypothetical protein
LELIGKLRLGRILKWVFFAELEIFVYEAGAPARRDGPGKRRNASNL